LGLPSPRAGYSVVPVGAKERPAGFPDAWSPEAAHPARLPADGCRWATGASDASACARPAAAQDALPALRLALGAAAGKWAGPAPGGQELDGPARLLARLAPLPGLELCKPDGVRFEERSSVAEVPASATAAQSV